MTRPRRSPRRRKEGLSLKESALALGFLNEEQFAQWVVPADMTNAKKPEAQPLWSFSPPTVCTGRRWTHVSG